MNPSYALVFNPYFPDWSVAQSIATSVALVASLVAIAWLVDR